MICKDTHLTDLLEEHRGMMVKLAHRYHLATEGRMTFEELFHEAQRALWEASEKFEASRCASFFTFAFNYVRNAVASAARNCHVIRVPRQESSEKWMSLLVPMVSLDAAITENGSDRHAVVADLTNAAADLDDDEVNRLHHLLNELPPSYASVLRLRFIQGLPMRDTAKALGVTKQAVNMRQQRGLVMLRRKILADRKSSLARFRD